MAHPELSLPRTVFGLDGHDDRASARGHRPDEGIAGAWSSLPGQGVYQRSLDVIAERGTGVCWLRPGSWLAGLLAFIAWPDPQELAYPLGCAAVSSGLDQREYRALHAGGQQDLPPALCPTPGAVSHAERRAAAVR